MPTKPNFVLIIGDDISDDDFGCYGHPTIQTPNVDKLAADGLLFSNAYLTTSQCSPTRCSLITGRYPHNTGAPELHMPLPAGQPMFPAELKRAGYYCVQAGKWHMGAAPRAAFDRIFETEKTDPGGEARWARCLQERPKDKPFFMWFASADAHRPWKLDDDDSKHKPEDVVIPPYLADTPATRNDLVQYYDEVARLDRYVGVVVEELRDQGVLDETCILFMADNGRPFARCKTRLYDSGIKTPFVVHWPKGLRQAGATCHSLISAIDIAPTILELAGLRPPESVQGVSFAPLLSNPEAKTRDHVFAEHNWHTQIAHERMVRWEDYVYIRNAHPELSQICTIERECPWKELQALFDAGKATAAQADPFIAPRPAEELFHLPTDPHQLTNLVDDANHRQALDHLRAILDEWRRRTGDTAPSLDEATPDRHKRGVGKSLFKESRPPTGVLPGQTAGATRITDPGPR